MKLETHIKLQNILTLLVSVFLAVVGLFILFMAYFIFISSVDSVAWLALLLMGPLGFLVVLICSRNSFYLYRAVKSRFKALREGVDVQAKILELSPGKFGRPPFCKWVLSFEYDGREYTVSDEYMSLPEGGVKVGSVVGARVVVLNGVVGGFVVLN